VISSVTTPSTQLTSGIEGGMNRIWRTTRSYSSSIGFMSGE
jgi:hypothetical protein